MKKLVVLLALTLLGGCEEAREPAVSNTANSQANVNEPIDTSRYIRAADVHQRFESNVHHFVFDVRNREAYQESHIRGSLSLPYGQFDQPELDAIAGLTQDSAIVTYCGCPHHLAGLAADLLIDMGYQNVRILYEGYWFWRDNNYPTGGLKNLVATELQFAGLVSDAGAVLAHTDVFIRNLRSNQLEAARTDAAGRFETGFHVLGYQPDDQFELRIGDLNAPVTLRTRADSDRVNYLVAG